MSFGHLFVPSQAPAGTQSFGWYGAIDQPRRPSSVALADGTVWDPQNPGRFPSITPSALGWLQPFPVKFPPLPVYDLNITWDPQVPAAIQPPPPPLEWLQAFAQRTAPLPFYDLNSGWVPLVPAPITAPPVKPFPITQFANRRFRNQVVAY